MTAEEAKQYVFNYWRYLHEIARKRFFNDPQLAEQAIDYLLEKLQRNDWQKIREYRGEGFTAFITVVANRLFTDFSRKIGDTPYIPTWIQQQGQLWKEGFLLLHKGLTRQEAIEQLWNMSQSLGYEKAAIIHVIETILHQETLPARYTAVSWETEQIENVAATQLSPDEELSELENDRRLELIFLLLEFLQNPADNAQIQAEKFSAYPKLIQGLNQLKQQITLNNEDYLLLSLIYREGLSVSEAGRRLQLNANQVAGRHRRLLTRLEQAFIDVGLAEELRLLIQ
ncbi:hypothetical protein [Thioflexithrix psekupsensis]|uniref:Uncharacterized protein n=1 Tax=Thioflexithrix psekupsensis TaxID=1570016 RepID=A0A251XC61_9GAMM|nr:hypothetical protein [Thioflexithrix psekupsensis]OUD16178.1 hypothetical protein TPSD3_00165 [Thioflexithrix psekupsensis]